MRRPPQASKAGPFPSAGSRRCLVRSIVFSVAIALLGSGDRILAIEMFTFFGDGSRIGLPSLEVPVEAYPGIPLRSDRIRMQRGRFARWRQAPRQQLAQPIPEPRQAAPKTSGGVRIRPMEAESKDWPVAPTPPD